MKKLLTIAAALLISASSFGQQCAGTTKAGAQCKRPAKTGQQYCYQHNPAAIHCGATTKAGKPCQRLVKTAGAHCSQHTSK